MTYDQNSTFHIPVNMKYQIYIKNKEKSPGKYLNNLCNGCTSVYFLISLFKLIFFKPTFTKSESLLKVTSYNNYFVFLFPKECQSSQHESNSSTTGYNFRHR